MQPRKKTDDKSTTSRLAELAGLAHRCPFGKEEADCPANCLRQETIEERIAGMKELSEEKIQDILNDHSLCARHREQNPHKPRGFSL
jgi:hypothetical protein